MEDNGLCFHVGSVSLPAYIQKKLSKLMNSGERNSFGLG